jgi:tRNA threonylcarbamoyladenosine modification (KEOPS) complex Cgi121 subunit
VLFDIIELGQHVWVSAFDTRPMSVEQILQEASSSFLGVSVQIVDLDRVPGSRYLLLATYNALKSYGSKQPISKSLAMELLVYISGNRQISEALRQAGVTPNTRRIAALAVGSSESKVLDSARFLAAALGRKSSDALLNDWTALRVENVRSGFGISGKELKAIAGKGEPVTRTIERLALERSAMLAVGK